MQESQPQTPSSPHPAHPQRRQQELLPTLSEILKLYHKYLICCMQSFVYREGGLAYALTENLQDDNYVILQDVRRRVHSIIRKFGMEPIQSGGRDVTASQTTTSTSTNTISIYGSTFTYTALFYSKNSSSNTTSIANSNNNNRLMNRFLSRINEKTKACVQNISMKLNIQGLNAGQLNARNMAGQASIERNQVSLPGSKEIYIIKDKDKKRMKQQIGQVNINKNLPEFLSNNLQTMDNISNITYLGDLLHKLFGLDTPQEPNPPLAQKSIPQIPSYPSIYKNQDIKARLQILKSQQQFQQQNHQPQNHQPSQEKRTSQITYQNIDKLNKNDRLMDMDAIVERSREYSGEGDRTDPKGNADGDRDRDRDKYNDFESVVELIGIMDVDEKDFRRRYSDIYNILTKKYMNIINPTATQIDPLSIPQKQQQNPQKTSPLQPSQLFNQIQISKNNSLFVEMMQRNKAIAQMIKKYKDKYVKRMVSRDNRQKKSDQRQPKPDPNRSSSTNPQPARSSNPDKSTPSTNQGPPPKKQKLSIHIEVSSKLQYEKTKVIRVNAVPVSVEKGEGQREGQGRSEGQGKAVYVFAGGNGSLPELKIGNRLDFVIENLGNGDAGIVNNRNVLNINNSVTQCPILPANNRSIIINNNSHISNSNSSNNTETKTESNNNGIINNFDKLLNKKKQKFMNIYSTGYKQHITKNEQTSPSPITSIPLTQNPTKSPHSRTQKPKPTPLNQSSLHQSQPGCQQEQLAGQTEPQSHQPQSHHKQTVTSFIYYNQHTGYDGYKDGRVKGEVDAGAREGLGGVRNKSNSCANVYTYNLNNQPDQQPTPTPTPIPIPNPQLHKPAKPHLDSYNYSVINGQSNQLLNFGNVSNTSSNNLIDKYLMTKNASTHGQSYGQSYGGIMHLTKIQVKGGGRDGAVVTKNGSFHKNKSFNKDKSRSQTKNINPTNPSNPTQHPPQSTLPPNHQTPKPQYPPQPHPYQQKKPPLFSSIHVLDKSIQRLKIKSNAQQQPQEQPQAEHQLSNKFSYQENLSKETEIQEYLTANYVGNKKMYQYRSRNKGRGRDQQGRKPLEKQKLREKIKNNQNIINNYQQQLQQRRAKLESMYIKLKPSNPSNTSPSINQSFQPHPVNNNRQHSSTNKNNTSFPKIKMEMDDEQVQPCFLMACKSYEKVNGGGDGGGRDGGGGDGGGGGGNGKGRSENKSGNFMPVINMNVSVNSFNGSKVTN